MGAEGMYGGGVDQSWVFVVVGGRGRGEGCETLMRESRVWKGSAEPERNGQSRGREEGGARILFKMQRTRCFLLSEAPEKVVG